MAEMSDSLRKSVASSAVLLRIGIFNRSHYEEVLVVRVHPDLLAAERLPAQARKLSAELFARLTGGAGS
jgi:polyphosphate kinase 2 (PPK2 family)